MIQTLLEHFDALVRDAGLAPVERPTGAAPHAAAAAPATDRSDPAPDRPDPAPDRPVDLGALPGASPAGVAAALVRAGSPLVVLAAESPARAEELNADLGAISGEGAARYLPQRETLPYEDVDPHVEISGQRVETLAALLAGRARLLVTTPRALAERTPVPRSGEEFGLELRVGARLRRAELVSRLEEMGFEPARTVQEIGELAVRGSIVDLFPFGTDLPLRIELWGDEIASLRRFDLLTQRSSERMDEVEVLPVELRPELFGTAETVRRSPLELLPEGTTIIELRPEDAREERRRLWEELVSARGEIYREDVLPPGDLALEPRDAAERISHLRRLVADGTSTTGGDDDAATRVDLGLSPPPAIGRDMDRLGAEIRVARQRGEAVLVLCDNQGQLERLEEILAPAPGRAPAGVRLAIGAVSGGFRLDRAAPLLVLTDHEIFERAHLRRRAHRFHGAATLESIASIAPGDYVVHLDHGIGRYRALERVDVGGEAIETLAIEYADGEILRVPHYRLDLVERWMPVGESDGAPPPVHKLGGRQWRTTRKRAEESIREMAAELIDLYAHRQVASGTAFSPETRWQREMEAAFLYEDTPDQREAWEDVRQDMETARIMDRLVCGDVGYGKTEIAIRAAFKAIQDGKQVAVLAPTTILVEQHRHTFEERLAAFPVRIEAVSRLRTAAEQEEILGKVRTGEVDILIGTHRLLSSDIRFHDLGLLVVDEEQRFGVRHKERLKEMKRAVDVLTLTATPIPRTLQLALGGLRDLSLIGTAPRDRMPVVTHVLPWSNGILRDAMRRELDRGGQVFFVHDRIETIDTVAERVRSLVPDASVEVAHGRMPERRLERTMDRLMAGEIDVLVSTSIIENGLDVASANTMIVHRAHAFGLAQLYQLRGRVGRSHHRAYCYLVVPDDITPEAERRLRVLEHHTELGSGYRVALEDLRLRGAGNLLGAKQSGFAQAVGFETYQRLLENAVHRLRGEETATERQPPQVAIEGDALLPDEYIGDPEQKMHLYRRISRLGAPAEMEDLRDEMRDRFGPLPPAAERLLSAVRLEWIGERLGIEWIRVSGRTARLNFAADAVPRLHVLADALSDRQLEVEVRRTQPLSLIVRKVGVEPLTNTLIDALDVLHAADRDAGGGVEPKARAETAG